MITGRVSGGVMLGTMRVARTFRTGATTWTLPDQSANARYAYVTPELRFGYAVGRYVELGLVFQAHLMFAFEQPSFAPDEDLFQPDLGFVDFPAESLTGGFVYALSPGLGLTISLY